MPALATRRAGMPKSAKTRVDDGSSYPKPAVPGELVDVGHPSPATRHPPEPWNLDQLQSLISAAASVPGDVAGLPACHWWPALVLVLLDTGRGIADAMAARPADFDRPAGCLALGWLRHELHPLTIQALDRLRAIDQAGRLFPWILDPRGTPYHMLYRQYRALLWRAGLPHVRANLFNRLRVTADRARHLLDHLDPAAPFVPRDGKPALVRARDRRRWQERAAQRPEPPRAAADRRRDPAAGDAQPAAPALVLIGDTFGQSVRRFFQETYIPLRLAAASLNTLTSYRGSLNRLDAFCACAVTFAQLSDDLLQRFAAWCLAAGQRPATVNRHLRQLLAMWRYAWRKGKTAELPRDVELVRELKREPSAWTIDEMGKILAASAAAAGRVGSIPARRFWPCFVLTIYETGLRLSALLALRPAHFNPDTGRLFVPAEFQKQRADQSFVLHSDTRQLLADLAGAKPAAADRAFLFPWPHGRERLWTDYRAILTAAGLPTTRRDLFHKLRRTSGTHLENAAGEAAAVQHLGHSSAAVYRKSYRDRSQLHAIQAGALLPRPAWSAIA